MEIESIHEYRIGEYEVRFWQTEDAIRDHYPNKSLPVVGDMMNKEGLPLTASAVAKLLAELSFCGAVQVKDMTMPQQAGIVIYPRWP